VPNVMVVDGAKAQVQGEFRRKLRDAGCNIRKTEPHTQASNMDEGGVSDLKWGLEDKCCALASPSDFGMTA
jgi:hypothetical protein